MHGRRRASATPRHQARSLADLPTFRPTFVLAVPRVFEKVYNTARAQGRTPTGKGAIFDRAADTAIAYSEALERRRPGPAAAAAARAVRPARLRQARARRSAAACAWAVSGGAPLGAGSAHFFRGIGVTVLEGYGLTETTAAATVNTRAGDSGSAPSAGRCPGCRGPDRRRRRGAGPRRPRLPRLLAQRRGHRRGARRRRLVPHRRPRRARRRRLPDASPAARRRSS